MMDEKLSDKESVMSKNILRFKCRVATWARVTAVIAFMAVCGWGKAYAADVNVLVIGSDTDLSGMYQMGDKATPSAAGVKTQLENILGGASLGTVNVVLQETYDYKGYVVNGTRAGYSYCANLATWFFYEYDEDGVKDTTFMLNRWKNLRGESGTDWDYVILVGDDITIDKIPGVYTLGVAKIAEEAAKGGAETILLMTRPGPLSQSTIAHHKEVVYRTGRSGGYKVAPAALAWQAAGSPAGATDNAYIGAASIYSRIWNKSAKQSSYTYNDGMADTVFTTVTANKSPAVQYTGSFNNTITRNGTTYPGPFAFHGDKSRYTSPREGKGSSTERDLAKYAQYAAERAGTVPGSDTGGKRYYITRYSRPADMNFMFSYQSGSVLPHIADNELKRTWSFLTPGNRFLPIRLIWGSIAQTDPYESPYAGVHISGPAYVSSGTFVYTIISGRCPVDTEPSPSTLTWRSQMAGYETAWQLATLQARAPGFKVIATSPTQARLAIPSVGKTTPEIVTVEFINPPKSNVTVTVTGTIGDVTITPQTLTFTPTNHNVKQQIALLATPGATPGAEFNIELNTSSDDEVYDKLYDIWSYKINTPPVANNQSIEAYSGEFTPITLTASDVDLDPLTYTIVGQPTYGTLILQGAVAVYQPDAGYLGPDSFTFVANDGNADSVEATVDLSVIPGTVYNSNLIQNPGAEIAPFTDYFWVVGQGAWQQSSTKHSGSFSFQPSTALAELYQDVDVSAMSGTINAGVQSFRFGGYFKRNAEGMQVILTCMNAASEVLDTQTIIEPDGWAYSGFVFKAPANTTTIRVLLYASGTSAWYDDLSLQALTPPNIAPVADDQFGVVVTSGIETTITLTASDGNDDDLTYRIISQPTRGIVTGIGPDMSYQSNPGYTGPDSFTFKANDGKLDSNLATVFLDVVPNQTPSIVLDSPRVTEVALPPNVGLLLETTVNDDGQPNPLTLTWSKISGPGTVTFTNPNEADTGAQFGSVGHYVLRLTADDGDMTVTQDVTVHFGYYSGYPNIGSHVNPGSGYSGIVGVAIDLPFASASDQDDQPDPPGVISTQWRQVSGPGVATFADDSVANGNVTIDAAGAHVLRLIADDGEVKSYNDVPVTVAVDPNNTAPTAESQTVLVYESSSNNAITLVGADTDGDPVTYTVVDQPANGALSGTAPNLAYTPTTDFSGVDSFTFKVNDGKADSSVVTVEITVINVPIIKTSLMPEADSYVRGGEKNSNFGTENVLRTNDRGWKHTYTYESYLRFDLGALAANTRSATLRLYHTSVGGADPVRKVTLVTNDSWLETGITYNNAPASTGNPLASWRGFNGEFVELDITAAVQQQTDGKISLLIEATTQTDSSMYVTFASREHPTAAWRPTLIVEYTQVPGTPVAYAQSVMTAKDTAKAITLTATDPDGDDLDYSIINGPTNGTLSGTAPNLMYTPDTGFSGYDNFTFTANDGSLDSIAATVEIRVGTPIVDAGVNQVVTPGASTVPWTPADISTTFWLDAADASTLLMAAGGQTYQAKSGDAIYQWQDKSGNNNHATQNTVNRKPILQGNYIEFDGAIGGSGDHLTASPILTSDITILGVVRSYSNDAATDGAKSWLSQTGGNNPDFMMTALTHSDTLAITLQDTGNGMVGVSGAAARDADHIHAAYSYVAGGADGLNRVDGGTAESAITTRANPVSQAGTSLNIGTQKVGFNTRCLEGRIYEIVIINQRLDSTDPDFLKLEGYLAHKWGLTANLPDGHPYKAAAPTKSGAPSATASLDATVSNAGNSPTITWSKVNGPGSVSFANASAFDTTATFTNVGLYTLRLTADDGFDETFDEVVINVNDGSGNSAPVASNASGNTDQDTATSVTLSATDADGDALTYSVVTAPANGSLSGTAPNLTYTPNSGFLGSDSFTFKTNDGEADSNFATISITVNLTPPAPYVTWAANSFTYPFNDVGMDQDPDGDGKSNQMEFAFGTDPTLKDYSPLLADGTVHGLPVPVSSDGGATFDLLFVRRKDHGISGSLNYIVQFSSDLGSFDLSSSAPTFVANSTVDTKYELMKVPYPPTAAFGRIKLTEVP
jgi:hypothetical protein